ncbi:hypothetical protein [Streptomyces sp. A1547]|uniref:hypothetical protein n=1 Tax=Streptomyces sp. A1547 TaxID=2563105 RepID=UPI00109EC06B|nr:hypothetical protein [Streptomyces sp. A1547]THA23364.1 hypothetical protein E6W17_41675 [Streptomyces sp. A1547]
MEEILFSGPGFPQIDETVARAVPRPLWLEVIEAAFGKLTSTEEGCELYGDPQRGGGTLEQGWRVFGLLCGAQPVCLLAAGRPEVPTAAIHRVISFSPGDLLGLLARALTALGAGNIPVNVYDGRAGHCVNLLGVEDESFIFHDPWPGRSLLCREQNVAGVDAAEHEQGWRITGEDLGKVVFSAFLWPSVWGDLTGEPTRIPYPNLSATEFFGFFNIHETERAETTVRLKTGGFQEHVDLTLELDARGRVSEATLLLRREWIADLNPFALDIAKSFLFDFVPVADREQVAPIADLLWRMGSLDHATAERTLRDDDPQFAMARVILGVQNEVLVSLPRVTVRAKNVDLEDTAWLELTVTYW